LGFFIREALIYPHKHDLVPHKPARAASPPSTAVFAWNRPFEGICSLPGSETVGLKGIRAYAAGIGGILVKGTKKMASQRKCWALVLAAAMIVSLGSYVGGTFGNVSSKPAVQYPLVPYYGLPERIDFCGEQAPLHVADVRERMDREFTIVVYNRAQVFLWLKRMERYFPWLEKQLAAKNLPDDLKYVAVAESDLMISAVSPAGAAGPWQFMASTGSNYGLNRTSAVDDRYDFEMAAAGAFRYLSDLHGMFNNWTLAVAAYNCGEKRVQDEKKNQKTASYYELKLPAETERYVFRILAIKEVLSHAEQYGYVLPKGEGYPPVSADKVKLDLTGPVPVMAAAEAAGVTYREMKLLNPRLISDAVPQGSTTVKVPGGRGKDFEANMAALKAKAKPACIFYKVGRGETLGGIAVKYHVDSKSLCAWNNMKEGKLRAGQVLKIYR
jgi:membrane-bound lytic murein transglycosylase D